jgi:hypothetical protein
VNANRELWEKGDFVISRGNRGLDGGTEIAATFLLVNVTRSYP